MVYVILGAPGSGKGTRSKILEEKLNMQYLSIGSMLREDKEMYEKYADIIEEGKLVPDIAIKEMIEKALSNKEKSRPAIIDGFPRTLNQAFILDDILNKINEKIQKVFLIEVDENTIYDRILNRTVCPKCGKIYDKKSALENNNKCSACGIALEKRKDDNKIALEERLKEHALTISSIKEYYEKQGLIEIIDGTEPPEKILERV